jgi:hypothetical protein
MKQHFRVQPPRFFSGSFVLLVLAASRVSLAQDAPSVDASAASLGDAADGSDASVDASDTFAPTDGHASSVAVTAAAAPQPTRVQPPPLLGDLADPSEFGAPEEHSSAASVRVTGLSGQVISRQTREPIVDALVIAVATPYRTRTNPAGRYVLELAPGQYTLRIVYPGYRTLRFDRVRVQAGQSTVLNSELPVETARTPLEARVAARADRNTSSTQLAIRRQSASVQDAISSQEMARSPDAAASDAVRRVVGVSIADGRYAVVRGLGGRYVNAMLNGVPLPPTDPDVPGVQLDLFPSSLLTSLSVVKSFMPELPADWAGGSLQISTRDFPDRLTISMSGSLGFDTLTHIEQTAAHGGFGALRYNGGAIDFLGFDDGTRALPASTPRTPLVLGINNFTQAQLTEAARAFPVRWALFRDIAMPNGSLGFQLGNTTQLFGRPLGYLLALSYSNSTRARLGRVARVRVESGQVVERERGEYNGTQSDVQLGALGTLSYSPAPDHDLSLVTLFNQASSDEAAFRTGFSDDAGSDLITRVQRMVQRTLLFVQLTGDHRQSRSNGIRARWSAFLSTSQRSEPDTRYFKYSLEEPSRPRAAFGTGGIDRIYTGLSQLEAGGGFDLTVPAGPIVVRGGALSRFTNRDFAARRFTYETAAGNDDADLPFRLPDQILASSQLGERVEIKEYTQANDGYLGHAQYVAPFVRLDTKLFGDRLRLAGGARVEYYRQFVLSSSPFVNEPPTYRTTRSETGALANCTDRTDVDILPAIGLVWESSPSVALRANYGRTVGRPLFRELAPFLFPDVVRNRLITGNPQLRTAHIHNFDLRLEYFASSQEVFAVSAFAKQFTDPIETVNNAAGSSTSLTYCNANEAIVLGGELEARMSFARLHRALSSLSVAANVSLSWSELNIQPDACGRDATFLLTNARRPLGGQSPVVANVVIGWTPSTLPFTATVFYNVYAARLEEAGANELPDVYQDTFHQLDFAFAWQPSARFSLRATAKNILGQPVTLRQGPIVVEERRAGQTFAIRAQLNF